MTMLGQETFRGTLGASMLRSTLYAKNDGAAEVGRNGLLRVDCPITGSLLVSPATAANQRALRDPVSGTTLRINNGLASAEAPVQKQQFVHSRQFYLTRDVDVTIQTLRNTTKVSRYTNEKIGTAGSSTGMDVSLQSFQKTGLQGF